MWDSPLCTMNMFYYQLVNKEIASFSSRAEYSKSGNPGRDRGGKKVESRRCQNLSSKPQLRGDTQNNRNGLD